MPIILKKRGSKKVAPPIKEKSVPSPSLVSQTVAFTRDGLRFYGRVKAVADGGSVSVDLAIPDDLGILHFCGTEVTVSRADCKEVDAVTGGRAQLFRSHQPIAQREGQECLKFMEVKSEEGMITDYRDIVLAGYASTFENVTKADRDGDRIAKDAYTGNLGDFTSNPVMLTNHFNNTKSQLGSFAKVQVDGSGLYVEGRVTNSPEMKHERFLIAEGHLKAFSVGGFFFFSDDDPYLIEKIELFEVSVVPIPANQDALFQRRSLTIDEVTEVWKKKALTF